MVNEYGEFVMDDDLLDEDAVRAHQDKHHNSSYETEHASYKPLSSGEEDEDSSHLTSDITASSPYSEQAEEASYSSVGYSGNSGTSSSASASATSSSLAPIEPRTDPFDDRLFQVGWNERSYTPRDTEFTHLATRVGPGRLQGRRD